MRMVENHRPHGILMGASRYHGQGLRRRRWRRLPREDAWRLQEGRLIGRGWRGRRVMAQCQLPQHGGGGNWRQRGCVSCLWLQRRHPSGFLACLQSRAGWSPTPTWEGGGAYALELPPHLHKPDPGVNPGEPDPTNLIHILPPPIVDPASPLLSGPPARLT